MGQGGPDVLYTCTRKLMRMSRSSLVFCLPGFVVKKMDAAPGDTFVVVYDDEKHTITYQRLFKGTTGPQVAVNGEKIQSELIP